MKSYSILILLSLITYAITACPNFTYRINDFDPYKFMGNWYEVIRSQNIAFEDGMCNAAYFYYPTPTQFNFNITAIATDNNPPDHDMKLGLATQDPKNKLLYQIKFDNWLQNVYTGAWNIIDTDYTSFALIYSCDDLFLTKLQYVWVLSRNISLNNQTLEDNLLNIITGELNYKKTDLNFTNQDNSICGRNLTSLQNVTHS